MKAFVVWVDRDHARLFQLSPEKMERKSYVEGKSPNHHTHALDNLDHQRLERGLFQEVVKDLKAADKILILGPGVAKYHFQAFLIEQYPNLGRKITACEAVDHPTDGQIAALARKHFDLAVTKS